MINVLQVQVWLQRQLFLAQARVLFALFGLQVFCQDRKAAVQLRDDLNRSCLIGNRGYPAVHTNADPVQ